MRSASRAGWPWYPSRQMMHSVRMSAPLRDDLTLTRWSIPGQPTCGCAEARHRCLRNSLSFVFVSILTSNATLSRRGRAGVFRYSGAFYLIPLLSRSCFSF